MQAESATKLKNNLKECVPNHIFTRGLDYYRSNQVTDIEIEIDHNNILIFGEVLGTYQYDSEISFNLKENYFFHLDCSCPYGYACKHSIALGLLFIDRYEKLLRQIRIENYNINEFAEILLIWINEGKILKIKEKENQKKILDPDILDLGYENPYQINPPKNQLINSEIIDINQSHEELENEFAAEEAEIKAEIEQEENLKKLAKNLSLIKNLKKSKKTSSKNKAKKQKEFNPKDYYFAIDIYRYEILFKRKNDTNVNLNKLLNTYPDIEKKYKECFESLEKIDFFYDTQDKIDFGKIFRLIQNTDILVKEDYNWYRKKEYKFQNNPKRLKVILKQEQPYIKDPYDIDFIFSLEEKFYDYNTKHEYRFFYGVSDLIIIHNDEINIYPFEEYLMPIVQKTIQAQRPIKLDKTDIINLNKIINQNSKYLYLDIQFDIKNFKIKESLNFQEKLLVNFDAQNSILEIEAIIDYEDFYKPIINLVYKTKQNNRKQIKLRTREGREKYLFHIEQENIFYAKRNPKREKKFFANLYQKYGFNTRLQINLKSDEDIFNFYETEWQKLKKLGYKTIWLKDKFEIKEGDFSANFDVDFNADNDWLSFDLDCYCNKDKINLDDLKLFIENKNKFFKTRNGNLLKFKNQKDLERLILMLESFYQKENNKFEGKIYNAPELENIFTSSNYYNAKVKKSFTKFINEAKSGKPVEKIKLPNKFNKTLRTYQKEGINWFYFLRKYRFAGILADDMGLGKTLQSLVLINLEKKKNKPSIVICPKTLLYNWQNEVEKFMPKLKSIVIDGTPGERQIKIQKAKTQDLIITSYTILKQDFRYYEKEKIRFNYCFLDEAQCIKNFKTKNAQIVKKINADYRLALTGTPLENTVTEIWSIFDFLMPGFLSSYKNFSKTFEKPIMKKSDKQALEGLQKKIKCFMLRRTKDKVLKELPPKIEQVVTCKLEDSQNILYQEILANVKSEIFETVKEKGFAKSQIHILAGLTKLRQVCNHPVLLLKEKNHRQYASAKLNAFSSLIYDILKENRKVLVFSQFTKMLDILENELKDNNIKYFYLSGKTQNRQKLIKNFNESDETKIFLISLKAGGVGLNLTSADNVIIFDPWWNPSVENQAIDRTHRIGQKNSVNVYRLITHGTIEERIVALQEKKKFLFDNLVGETSNNLFSKLTWDDIKQLFQ